MQETTTTCDRCGKVETEDTPNWSALWVMAGGTSASSHVDLCDQCGKALLGWVQSGPEVRVE